MSTELKITKEAVLAAAAKCSTDKATLETLFPEVFNTIDLPVYQAIVDSLGKNIVEVSQLMPSAIWISPDYTIDQASTGPHYRLIKK